MDPFEEFKEKYGERVFLYNGMNLKLVGFGCAPDETTGEDKGYVSFVEVEIPGEDQGEEVETGTEVETEGEGEVEITNPEKEFVDFEMEEFEALLAGGFIIQR